MDSVTHIFLGAAIAQVAVGRRVGFPRAFLIGALAATLPDADALFYTGEAVRDHALHRHFMHALVMVPVLAYVALLPFMLFSRASRPLWRPLYCAALLACVLHTLLDLLTSYGTMILWPFSSHRYALDIVAVVDPLYTLPLMVGVIVAWRLKSARPAVAALLVSSLYMGFAAWQHGRAEGAQHELLAARGVADPVNPRVLPQVGAVVSYRSIYIAGGMIHADAIRVPYFAAATFKTGSAIPLMKPAELAAPTAPNAAHDFNVFASLADGYLARSPGDPLLLADERYTFVPEGLEPVWGIQLEQTDKPLFRITPRWDYFPKLLRDLFRPRGYVPLTAVHL